MVIFEVLYSIFVNQDESEATTVNLGRVNIEETTERNDFTKAPQTRGEIQNVVGEYSLINKNTG